MQARKSVLLCPLPFVRGGARGKDDQQMVSVAQ